MGWFQLPGTNKIDEHDEPTEPIPLVDTLPIAPPQQGLTLPAPPPANPAVPNQPGQAPPAQKPSPPQPYHPYAPPPPATQQGPAQENGEKIKSGGAGKPARGSGGRSLKPLLPGFFFITVQLLLLLRFFLKITGLMADQWWVGVIMGVSEVFVSPFRALLLQVSLQLPAQVEVYTLLAVLVYGLISRLLVRLLKIILRSY